MSEVVGEAVVVVRQDESQLDLGGSGKRAGDGFASGFGGVLKRLPAIIGIAAVGAAVSKAFTGALNFDAGAKRIQAQLGLTQEQSAQAGEVAGSLYADNFGDSLEDTQAAVGTVLSSIKGLRDGSEEDLNAAAKAALGYADVFGTEIPDAVSAAQQVINSGLAGDAVEAFDLLTAASQRVPEALRQDLFDASVEYSKSFDQIGLSGEQAFGVLAQASDQGVFGLDKAGDAVKEFTIRATDMSSASTDAYKTLGLDAQESANAILAGGDKASAATQKVVDGLLAIKDPSEQANTAIALFGTPLEDLGTNNIPKFLDSLSGTGDALGDVAGATEKATDTLYDTPLVEMQARFRKLQAGVQGLAIDALPYLIDAMDTVRSVVVDAVAPVLTDVLMPALSQAGDVITSEVLPAAETLWEGFRANLMPVLETVGDLVMDTLLPAVSSLGTYLVDSLVPVVTQVADVFVAQVLPAIAGLATFVYGTLYPALISIYTVIATNLRPVLDTLIDVFLTRILPTFAKVVDQIRNELVPALQPIIEKVIIVAGVLVFLASKILGVVLPPLIRLAGFIIAHVVPAVVTIITWVARFINGVLELGIAVGKGIAAVVGFADTLGGKVQDAVQGVVDAVTSLPGRITALGGKMLSAGKSIIGAFVDGLKNAGGVVSGIAGNVWDTVRGLINSGIDQINAALSFTISLPGPDININPPDIPHLQSGTNYFGGGLALVGEQGPELAALPTGARVYTATETRKMFADRGEQAATTARADDAQGQGNIYIGTLAPHNYDEFEKKMAQQRRLAGLGGRRPVVA